MKEEEERKNVDLFRQTVVRVPYVCGCHHVEYVTSRKETEEESLFIIRLPIPLPPFLSLSFPNLPFSVTPPAQRAGAGTKDPPLPPMEERKESYWKTLLMESPPERILLTRHLISRINSSASCENGKKKKRSEFPVRPQAVFSASSSYTAIKFVKKNRRQLQHW